MLDYMQYLWAGFLLLCIIAEAQTAQLVAVWFMPGALVAVILALLDVPVFLQVSVFVVISLLLLLFMRPLAAKFLKAKPEPTNADRAVGADALITAPINGFHAVGQAKVLGQIWSARGEDPNAVFYVGDIARVLRIEGVFLVLASVPREGEPDSAAEPEQQTEYPQ